MLVALAAYAQQVEGAVLVMLSKLATNRRFCHLDDVGVECAGEAAVCGNDDQQHRIRLFPMLKQLVGCRIDVTLEVADDLRELVCVRACLEDGFLGTAQLGSGYHFHGPRYLLRIFDRCDPLPDVTKACHIAFLESGWLAVVHGEEVF